MINWARTEIVNVTFFSFRQDHALGAFFAISQQTFNCFFFFSFFCLKVLDEAIMMIDVIEIEIRQQMAEKNKVVVKNALSIKFKLKNLQDTRNF